MHHANKYDVGPTTHAGDLCSTRGEEEGVEEDESVLSPSSDTAHHKI